MGWSRPSPCDPVPGWWPDPAGRIRRGRASARIIVARDHFIADPRAPGSARDRAIERDWAAGRDHSRAGAQLPDPRPHPDPRPQPARVRHLRQPLLRLPHRPVRRRDAHQQRHRDQGRPPLPRPVVPTRVRVRRRSRDRRRLPALPAGLRARRRDQRGVRLPRDAPGRAVGVRGPRPGGTEFHGHRVSARRAVLREPGRVRGCRGRHSAVLPRGARRVRGGRTAQLVCPGVDEAAHR